MQPPPVPHIPPSPGDFLAVVEASYRHLPVAALGAVALPRDDLAQRLPRIAASIGAQELIYIGTCNRLTFAVVGPDGAAAYRERLRSIVDVPLRAWQGDGAVEHLLRVAAGLESARRGEPEIRNQVRSAWTVARAAGTSGAVLNRLFADIVKAATEVQAAVARTIGVVSLCDGALAQVRHHFQQRRTQDRQQDDRRGGVLIVGVSAMTQRCAAALAADGHALTIASRTRPTAAALADEVRGAACTFDEMHAIAGPFDTVIAAAGGDKVLVSAQQLRDWAPPSGLLAVDFGVPANLDPRAADQPDIALLDMDGLIALARGSDTDGDLDPAMEIVDRHLDRLKGEAALRQAAPAIDGVVRHHQALLRASLEEIDPSQVRDREGFSQWADLMSRQFLHATLMGVRTLAVDAGPGAVESFLRGLSSAVPSREDPRS